MKRDTISEVVSLCKQWLTLQTLAQVLSGAVVFHSCQLMLDLLILRRKVGSGALPVFLTFSILVPVLLSMLTIGWYRWSRHRGGILYPEFNVLLGTVVFMPLYSVIASMLLYHPRPLFLSEIAREIFWLYLSFPLAILEISTYHFTLGAISLAFITVPIVGYLIRARSGATSNGMGTYPRVPVNER